MKPILVFCVLLVSLASSEVTLFSGPERAPFGAAAGEAFGALVGGAVVLGGVAAMSVSLAGPELHTPDATDEILLGVGVGFYVVPAGFAGGASLAGLLMGQRGEFGPAYVGALIGLPAGMAVAAGGLLGDRAFGTGPWLTVAGCVVGAALPTYGAVWAYNSSRPPAKTSTTVGLPELGLSPVSSDAGDFVAVDCRLVSIRF